MGVIGPIRKVNRAGEGNTVFNKDNVQYKKVCVKTILRMTKIGGVCDKNSVGE